jgi:hypothetical protein
MKVVLVGDIHNRWKQTEKFLTIPADRYIFLGDYWDMFYDDIGEAQLTCLKVKELLQRNDTTLLFGNHDVSYRIGETTRCSGWTSEKNQVIHELMTEEDWSKMKYYEVLEDTNGIWLISHAGFHSDIFTHPIFGESLDYIHQKMKNAIEHLELFKCYPDEMAAGLCRGGGNRIGGMLWCDFNQELVPFETFNQVFGHTPSRIIKADILNTQNYCIDSCSRECLVWEDGKCEIINGEKL